MNAWLQSLNPRERLIVIGGGALALVTALYILVVEPMWQSLAEERAQVQSQAELLTWMQRSAAEVARLGRADAAPATTSRPPYLLLDAAVRRNGLPAPLRLEPRGRDGAAAQFENVAFDRLLVMLGQLEGAGELQIADVSVTRRDEISVNANIVLQRP